MERTAQCVCGQLSLTVNGEPKFIVACSCLSCQKRTGSVFGVNAYFPDTQIVTKAGELKEFTHQSEAGRWVKHQFCPACGTSVSVTAEFQPGVTGVAVGCFADPNFPGPVAAAWNAHKHPWVEFPTARAQSLTQDFNKPQ